MRRILVLVLTLGLTQRWGEVFPQMNDPTLPLPLGFAGAEVFGRHKLISLSIPNV